MKQIYLSFSLILLLSDVMPAQNCAPDTVAPDFSTPMFLQGVNILPTGMTTIWAVDFADSLQDNCSDPSKLKVQVRREVMPTGCPPFSNVGWQDYATFYCMEVGFQDVYVRVIDEAGNIREKYSPVIVQDITGFCGSSNWNTGDACAAALNGDPLEDTYWDVFFNAGVSSPGWIYSEGSTCIRYFPIVSNWPHDVMTTVIRPTHQKNLLNGVTTYDLVLISKHILGYDTIDNPYYQLAADVNRSGSITTADIVAVRKVLLGLESSFPNNGSWRLMPESYNFPDPAFAFAEPVPDSLVITYPNTETCFRFKGLKVGDVNGSASTGNAVQADDRQVLPLLMPAIEWTAGTSERVPVTLSRSMAIEGFQIAFRYDPAGLVIEDVLSTLPDAQGGVQFFNDAENGILRLNWFAPVAIALEAGSALFQVQVRALQSGAVRLQPANEVVRGELYTPAEHYRLQMVYRDNPTAHVLAPLQPNPWSGGEVWAPVYLAEASLVTLRMFDLNGRLLHSRQEPLPEGMQQVSVPEQVLSAMSGLILYQISADNAVVYGKLMLPGSRH